MWFLDQLAPGNPFYNVPSALRLKGRLEAAVLERALNVLVERHAMLRTTFASVDGEPRQVVHASLPLPLAVLDLSQLPEALRQERLAAAVEAEAHAPFDLAQGPLLRSTLLRLGDEDHVWLYSVHHIVADGWSMGVILHEVANAYAELLRGVPARLAPLPIQYADYACWQRQRLDGAALQGQLDFWRRTLAGAPILLEIPGDRPRPAVQRFVGATFSSTLGADTLAELDALARHTQGTRFNVLLAALDVLLWRYSGQRDLCVGTPFRQPRQGRARTPGRALRQHPGDPPATRPGADLRRTAARSARQHAANPRAPRRAVRPGG